MALHLRNGCLSFADFIELVHDDSKADLLDGVIFMASPENTDHNELLGWLYTLLRGFVEARGLGRVTINKVAYRLTDKTAPEPDLGFVRADRVDRIKRGYVDGPPDLAVEFVSPDSVDRDYDLKRRRYEEAGVSEYWIIDPDEQQTTFLVRDSASKFVEALLETTLFRSRTLPGFVLDTRWLWQSPLPSSMKILLTMLGAEK